MLGTLLNRGSHLALSIFILRFLSVRTVHVDDLLPGQWWVCEHANKNSTLWISRYELERMQ